MSRITFVFLTTRFASCFHFFSPHYVKIKMLIKIDFSAWLKLTHNIINMKNELNKLKMLFVLLLYVPCWRVIQWLASKCSYFVFRREAPSLCSLMWPWLWPVNSHRLSSVLPGMFLWTQVSQKTFLNLTVKNQEASVLFLLPHVVVPLISHSVCSPLSGWLGWNKNRNEDEAVQKPKVEPATPLGIR